MPMGPSVIVRFTRRDAVRRMRLDLHDELQRSPRSAWRIALGRQAATAHWSQFFEKRSAPRGREIGRGSAYLSRAVAGRVFIGLQQVGSPGPADIDQDDAVGPDGRRSVFTRFAMLISRYLQGVGRGRSRGDDVRAAAMRARAAFFDGDHPFAVCRSARQGAFSIVVFPRGRWRGPTRPEFKKPDSAAAIRQGSVGAMAGEMLALLGHRVEADSAACRTFRIDTRRRR